MAAAPIIRIEKGIPLPSAGAPHGTYPFAEMEVGDSFVIPLTKRPSISSVLGRYGPKRFVTRKISDTECRVWRVA